MKAALAVLAVLVIVATIFATVAYADWQEGKKEDRLSAPLRSAAASFPVPVGSQTAFPETVTVDPRQVTRGWNAAGNLDAACLDWREAYRAWLGPVDAGRVSGEHVPGVTCNFSAKRGVYDTTLQITAFGAASPQATLSVAQR